MFLSGFGAKVPSGKEAIRVVTLGVWESERVGFEPPPVIGNKDLIGFPLALDPPDPHKSLGRGTY